MNRIDGIEALLKSVQISNEWIESACLSAVAVIVGCEEGKVSSGLVKSLTSMVMNETIDMWITQNGVRTPSEDGVPANRLATSKSKQTMSRPAPKSAP